MPAAGEIFEKTPSKSAPQAKILQKKALFYESATKNFQSPPRWGGDRKIPPPGRGGTKLNTKSVPPLKIPPPRKKNPPPTGGGIYPLLDYRGLVVKMIKF